MIIEAHNLIKRRQRDQGYTLLVQRLLIPDGARLAITGPSGCGKSTTLDMLGLILKPDNADSFLFSPREGTVYDIMKIWASDDQDELAMLRLSSMGYVLQTGDLLPFLNVRENILLTAQLAGIDRQQAARDCQNLASELGVASLMDAMPTTLSVGERQRVAIARALVSKPRLILADEPTAALDPLHASQVMKTFLQVVAQSGATLVVVTHNAPWATEAGLVEAPFHLEEQDDGITAILDYIPQGQKR